MASQDELSVVTDTYDLLLWTLKRIEKFPRSHRFALGSRMEAKLFEVLDLVIEAKLTHDKADVLHRAALLNEQVRFLVRAAKDLGFISLKRHHYACECLDQIGKQLAGWRRHVEGRQ